MISCCGYCPHNGNVVLTTYPPKIRCELTGKLHYTKDSCDVDDMVAVVRCKDCKYCSVDRHADGNVPDYVCIEMDCGVEPNGFCAWGEKRENAE